MDIREDLEDFIANNGFDDSFIEEQIKKLHLFKILSISNKLEQKVKTDFFSKDNIKFLKIYLHDDDRRENHYLIGFNLFNDNELVRNFSDKKFVEKHDYFISLLKDQIEGSGSLSDKLINIDIKDNPKYLALKPGIGEKLIDILLSKELKSILDYNKLQLNIPVNHQSNQTKIKI